MTSVITSIPYVVYLCSLIFICLSVLHTSVILSLHHNITNCGISFTQDIETEKLPVQQIWYFNYQKKLSYNNGKMTTEILVKQCFSL